MYVFSCIIDENEQFHKRIIIVPPQFTCGPLDTAKVQRGLEELGLQVTSAERTYTPKEVVTISKDHADLIDKTIVKMDEIPEIVKYYFNYEVDETSS